MSFHPSLPDRHHLVAPWQRFSKAIAPLLALHDALLRQDDSELEIGERELIAAHVSDETAHTGRYSDRLSMIGGA